MEEGQTKHLYKIKYKMKYELYLIISFNFFTVKLYLSVRHFMTFSKFWEQLRILRTNLDRLSIHFSINQPKFRNYFGIAEKKYKVRYKGFDFLCQIKCNVGHSGGPINTLTLPSSLLSFSNKVNIYLGRNACG